MINVFKGLSLWAIGISMPITARNDLPAICVTLGLLASYILITMDTKK